MNTCFARGKHLLCTFETCRAVLICVSGACLTNSQMPSGLLLSVYLAAIYTSYHISFHGDLRACKRAFQLDNPAKYKPEEVFVYHPSSSRFSIPCRYYIGYVGWGWFVRISLSVRPQMLALPKAIVLSLKKYMFSPAEQQIDNG